jgi:hypothetical protein
MQPSLRLQLNGVATGFGALGQKDDLPAALARKSRQVCNGACLEFIERLGGAASVTDGPNSAAASRSNADSMSARTPSRSNAMRSDTREAVLG